MRRILTLLALLVVALGLNGCATSSPNQGAAPADKTTTTAPPSPSANTSASNTNTSKQTPGSAPTGIKPPMKDEK